MSTETKMFRLSSGEELISNVTKTTSDEMVLDRPRVLMLSPDMQGNVGLKLLPFSAGNPGGIYTIKTKFIVGQSQNVPIDLEKAYMQSITNIQMAP